MLRLLRRRVLRVFAIIERPAAWFLLLGGFVVFVGVLVGFISTGSAKWATLLVAADLIVGGFLAVQDVEDE